MNDFLRFDLSDAAPWITPPEPDTDKYGRGVLGVVTGSSAYPGAAVIGVDAAVHTGVGMVRYVGTTRATDFVLTRRPEIVSGVGRVQAWLVGSGTDPAHLDPETASGFDAASSSDGSVPLVVDAGALSALDLRPGSSLAGRAVLTPHAGELAALLDVARSDVQDAPADSALRAADQTGAVVLLKGRQTRVVTPGGGVRLVVESGNGWLAAAGAGDALGGVLGALVATRAVRGAVSAEDLAHLAAAAAMVHGTAAIRASGGGPFPITALTEALSGVVAELVRG
ncbi:ADP-dependent NAD(P)H-hydrate dehydratase [Curtobacterium sp. Leaf261]|uniref:ADP-dependent NAD(P)H-hydrate dehydratase n=1 Tax=Curtobacterium sp. Leaf261 TaxID=1736311 RepID=UPI0009E9E6B6|nr:ADP/ATP-dependent (S)-NAD(P)H-hydrate dehydratase [Curtobacterium sp. Leaf261]